MDNRSPSPTVLRRQGQLLATLYLLLAIQATETRAALNQATQLVSEVLGADKADVFLYDPAVDTLVAEGTSGTPMGRRQIALGLDRLPLSNGLGLACTWRGESPKCMAGP